MAVDRIAKLEDYGIRNATSPQERYAQYVEDCKELPRHKQAGFWLKIIEHDKEVSRLVKKLGDGQMTGNDRRKH